MSITLTGRHLDISTAFKTTVEEGLEEVLTKHMITPMETNVVVSKHGHTFHSDIHAHVGRGINLRASGEGDDAYTCFHNALEVLRKNLRRHKKRLVDFHRHHDVHREEVPELVINGAAEELPHDEQLAPAVIAEMKTDLPTLCVGDAIMWFDLSGEAAFVFRNAANHQINVVFRRKDGNIGWIDPQTTVKNGH